MVAPASAVGDRPSHRPRATKNTGSRSSACSRGRGPVMATSVKTDLIHDTRPSGVEGTRDVCDPAHAAACRRPKTPLRGRWHMAGGDAGPTGSARQATASAAGLQDADFWCRRREVMAPCSSPPRSKASRCSVVRWSTKATRRGARGPRHHSAAEAMMPRERPIWRPRTARAQALLRYTTAGDDPRRLRPTQMSATETAATTYYRRL